jgi:serine protease Do
MSEQKDKSAKSVAAKAKTADQRQPRTVTFTLPNMPRPNLSRPNVTLDKAWTIRATALGLVFLLLSFLAGYGGAQVANHNTNNESVLNTTSLNGKDKIVTSESQLISKIVKDVGPSVVSVNVNITTDQSNTNSDFGGLFGLTQPQSEQAAGTGIIISDSGVIITNRHVVPTGTTNVSVTLSDGTQLKDVSVIGRTNDNDPIDVAFLKINDAKGHKLTPAAIGNSANVQVGDDVVAIGNALGQFQNTVTSGIISGYGRSVQASDGSGASGSEENLDNLFQTDAAINEGNSGGPLVNLNGQVIGINTAVAGNAQNIGFAIPVNDIRGLISQVLKNGKFERPYLGVRYVPLTEEAARAYDLKQTSGAYVAPSNDPNNPSIVSGSPAEKAGLQERDIITEIDGAKVDQNHSLTSLLAQHQPGDKVSLTVIRGDETLHISATIGALPNASNQ